MYYGVNYAYPTPMQSYPKPPSKFRWSLMLYVGLGIALLVIIIYIIWIYRSYRYSSGRIAGKLLSKYKAKNKAMTVPRFTEDEYNEIAIETATINTNKTIASAQVLLRNKETRVASDSTIFTAVNKNTCSPLDNSCVKL